MADAASRRPSILATILRIESGGRNIPQNIDDINMRRGTPAQGYFQIINPTWSEFGGDKTGRSRRSTRPTPCTPDRPEYPRAALGAGHAGRPCAPPATSPSRAVLWANVDALRRRPECHEAGRPGRQHGGGHAAGWPAGRIPPAPATPIDGAKADKEKEEAAEYAALTKGGLAAMAAEEAPAAPPVQPARAGGLLQASAPVPLPDFTKPAPTLPDFLEMLSQQRLRRA